MPDNAARRSEAASASPMRYRLDVHQAPDLRAQGLHQPRMIVAQRIDGDSRQGIEIGLALLVEQATAFAVGKGDRQAARRYSSDAA
jgi:hypothetical protein